MLVGVAVRICTDNGISGYVYALLREPKSFGHKDAGASLLIIKQKKKNYKSTILKITLCFPIRHV